MSNLTIVTLKERIYLREPGLFNEDDFDTYYSQQPARDWIADHQRQGYMIVSSSEADLSWTRDRKVMLFEDYDFTVRFVDPRLATLFKLTFG